MATMDGDLVELAHLCGISTEFWDWKGHHTEISPETVVAVLASLDIDVSDPDKTAQALQQARDKPWRRALPPCVVTEEATTAYVNVHVSHGSPAILHVHCEDGTVQETQQVDNWAPPRELDGRLVGEATFKLPESLPPGYHRLVLLNGTNRFETTLIVSPRVLRMPAALGTRRIWGYAAQLYSLHSAGSWGVGDLTDLTDLAVWSATQQSAGYVQVNPLHAAEAEPPITPSPYLPTSRLFGNPLYIRPEAIPEFSSLDADTRCRIAELHSGLMDSTAASDLIQRDPAWLAKRAALRLIYQAGRRAARQMAFEGFRHRQGRSLRDFATWWVLCGYLGNDWREWAPEYQRPTSPEVTAFRQEHADEIDFAEWLQWVLADQLSEVQCTARDAGMPVGVVADLAVGVSEKSADAWMMPDVYAQGVTAGAPPDAYNQLGQEWGQPPWRPDRLEELAYAPFRDMVATALQHAGGVRIDHIIGLFRLWWIPKGYSPRQGTYVRFNHEALIGILLLEASRAGALVVGEDLGTVEPWAREYLGRRGILGTSVLWFEEDAQGNPRPPEQWRPLCQASVVTHDLPPSAGYLALEHVKLRHQLGLLTESLEEELQRARGEQQKWREYLATHDVVDLPGADPVEAEVLGLYHFLTRTPSRMICVALVDAVGDVRVQNQPGTDQEYPNWQIPLSSPQGHPVSLEELFALQRPMRLAAVLNGWSAPHTPWTTGPQP